jgi:hypothetical protein
MTKEIPDEDKPGTFNRVQVKFTYPIFNRRLETLTPVVGIDDNLYQSTIQALRLFTDQVYNEFMEEMNTMTAADYELYASTADGNMFERAFGEGQIQVRVATSNTKCDTPLLTRDFPDEIICVKPSNHGPQPVHEADESLRYRRDAIINNTRLANFMDMSAQPM